MQCSVHSRHHLGPCGQLVHMSQEHGGLIKFLLVMAVEASASDLGGDVGKSLIPSEGFNRVILSVVVVGVEGKVIEVVLVFIWKSAKKA